MASVEAGNNPYLTAMVLMPLSLMASFGLVFYAGDQSSAEHMFWALSRVASFYCGWALYKRLFMGDKKDLGHISMGFLSVVSFFRRPRLTIFATAVVLLHYALAAYIVFVQLPSAKALARAVKKSTSDAAIVWAWTLRCYMVVNILFWYLVLQKAYSLLLS